MFRISLLVSLSLLLACSADPGPVDPPVQDAGVDGGCDGIKCQPSCEFGFADCDGNPANGCEVNVQASVDHCGACNRACEFSNGVAACAAGECVMERCAPGYADCNGRPDDGCELPTTEDPNNCGGCGIACGAGEVCGGGQCQQARRLFGFGGEIDESHWSDEAFSYDPAIDTFAVIPTVGTQKPGARIGHVGAYDTAARRMIVFGGSRMDASGEEGVWALDLTKSPAQWSQLQVTNAGPGIRYNACSGYDDAHRQLYVYGGVDEYTYDRNDLWRLDLQTLKWECLDKGEGASPPFRSAAACAFDTQSQSFVMFGGVNSDGSQLNDLWTFPADNVALGWRNVVPETDSPAARAEAKFFESADSLTLFGGDWFDQTNWDVVYPNDLQKLELGSRAGWAPLTFGLSPMGRVHHATATLDGKLYVYGGYAWLPNEERWTWFGDLVGYSVQNGNWVWSSLTPSTPNRPQARAGVVLVAPR